MFPGIDQRSTCGDLPACQRRRLPRTSSVIHRRSNVDRAIEVLERHTAAVSPTWLGARGRVPIGARRPRRARSRRSQPEAPTSVAARARRRSPPEPGPDRGGRRRASSAWPSAAPRARRSFEGGRRRHRRSRGPSRLRSPAAPRDTSAVETIALLTQRTSKESPNSSIQRQSTRESFPRATPGGC